MRRTEKRFDAFSLSFCRVSFIMVVFNLLRLLSYVIKQGERREITKYPTDRAVYVFSGPKNGLR